MATIGCKLICSSIGPHVEQIYTGFHLLADSGLVRFSQEIRPYPADSPRPQYLRDIERYHAVVEVACGRGGMAVLDFDSHDAMDISAAAVDGCHHYFKRSYSSTYLRENHGDSLSKIHPLGLNYVVLPDKADLRALWRSVALATSLRETIAAALAALDGRNWLRFHPRLRHLHSLPCRDQPPHVLFMATAYDPYDVTDRPLAKIEERIHHNEFRAACIRRLRREFGQRFFGGFDHTRYTIRHYKDVLLDRPDAARKQNYLRRLHGFPICVATTGLHGSIGWKFSEYVAFSKAIVSEPLRYEVPGSFAAGRNYLEFATPDECVAQCVRLVEDGSLREAMMFENAAYYQRYVRPDMLVMNAILTAMRGVDGQGA